MHQGHEAIQRRAFVSTLVKLRGYKVLETPVKHSPRLLASQNMDFNLALRVYRSIGIRWMKSRYLRYEVAEVPERKDI